MNNIEQFEALIYDLSKKACGDKFKVVIAYEGDECIIADEEYIKTYHPNAKIVSD